MVHHHVSWSQRSLKVVVPYLKGFESGKQFLVVDIVVEFGGVKVQEWKAMGWTSLSVRDTVERMAARVQSNASISIMSREPGIQCISTGAVVKAFFSVLKAEWNLLENVVIIAKQPN